VVKVLDFGLAKLVAPDAVSDEHHTDTWSSDSDGLSRSGTIAGTPPYMSPEQATGGRVDARSDVFAFGSMLYEMVTGRRAFAGNSASATLAAVVGDQPKPPSEIVSDLPRDLEKLILRCLRKEPDRRFQHMGDVKVELLEVKENRLSVLGMDALDGSILLDIKPYSAGIDSFPQARIAWQKDGEA
jgi:serine/threonine protein kinase